LVSGQQVCSSYSDAKPNEICLKKLAAAKKSREQTRQNPGENPAANEVHETTGVLPLLLGKIEKKQPGGDSCPDRDFL
jgi:hypothetical protein